MSPILKPGWVILLEGWKINNDPMKRIKIVFLCHFSNAEIRNNLDLKNYKFRNILKKIRGLSLFDYDDFAIWVSDYIQEFENHPEYEFHIVAPHKGMKKEFQHFEIRGVNYSFYKCDSNYIVDLSNQFFHLKEKNDYSQERRRISSIVESLCPDIIILCGAENPYYSSGVLDIENTPIVVILQTLLNDPKRIEMAIGSSYRRRIESEIFRHAKFFCTTDNTEAGIIRDINAGANILPVLFPSHRPIVQIPNTKDYDFVFFARSISKNKGIEHVLEALAIVKLKKPNVRLNVIGGCAPDYKNQLDTIIMNKGINDNVVFSGYFNQIQDTYKNVVKSRSVVVPGITASLNSTIREAMLIGLPTICYETFATVEINQEKQCLFTAKMEDVQELAKQMLITIDNPNLARIVGDNGKEYAEREFGNESIVNNLLRYSTQIINNTLRF